MCGMDDYIFYISMVSAVLKEGASKVKVGIPRTSISQEKSLILDASSFEMAETLLISRLTFVCAG
jgi:hypothetical protein